MLADIFNAIMSTASTVIHFVAHLPEYTGQVLGYVSHLPSFLVGAATMMVPVLILNKLMHSSND